MSGHFMTPRDMRDLARDAWHYRRPLGWFGLGLVGSAAPLVALGFLADWAYPYAGEWGWVGAFVFGSAGGVWLASGLLRKAMDALDEDDQA